MEKARILVVDDEPDITLVLKRGLENAGFDVDVFNDPQRFLANFKPNYYSLMLIDIKMPEMTGFQLFREIRKRDSKAKVCFMTAFEIYQKEFETLFPSYEVKCFIRKPVKISELQTIVQSQIGQ